MEAIARANVDHAGSYGEDGWTQRFDDLIQEHFGPEAVGFPSSTAPRPTCWPSMR